jgi:pyruvate/2-oxoglutarate dehydrogenase complex dihydrolipoamide acyltransferase (E2) component
VLGGGSAAAGPEQALAAAEAAEPARSPQQSEPPNPVADALEAGARARGHQRNISFFAYTATPKGRTLEQFGRLNLATGKHEAFHLYTMQQAIEEGFILRRR